DPPGVQPVGDTVADQEPRAPDDILDDRPTRPWAPGIHQVLQKVHRRLGRRLVHIGHELETAVRKRHADELTLRREEDDHLVGRHATGQVDVGKRVRRTSRPGSHRDTGRLTYGAVHAVGADHIIGAYAFTAGEGGGHAGVVLIDPGHHVWAQHPAAEVDQPLQQDRL